MCCNILCMCAQVGKGNFGRKKQHIILPPCALFCVRSTIANESRYNDALVRYLIRRTPPPTCCTPDFFTGHDPARGSGQKVSKDSLVESGRVRSYSKCHGTGQVGSGQEFFHLMGRVGSPFGPIRPARRDRTRERP